MKNDYAVTLYAARLSSIRLSTDHLKQTANVMPGKTGINQLLDIHLCFLQAQRQVRSPEDVNNEKALCCHWPWLTFFVWWTSQDGDGGGSSLRLSHTHCSVQTETTKSLGPTALAH